MSNPVYRDMNTQDAIDEAYQHSLDEVNTVELVFSDGTAARWVIVDDKMADKVSAAIEAVIGQPDTLT